VQLVLLFCRTFSNGGICKSSDRLDGKIVLVTGGNTGIGKETAEDLVKRGVVALLYTTVTLNVEHYNVNPALIAIYIYFKKEVMSCMEYNKV